MTFYQIIWFEINVDPTHGFDSSQNTNINFNSEIKNMLITEKV